MKLRELRETAEESHQSLLDNLKVTHDDYERWLRNPLTKNVQLWFERLYYENCQGKDVDWVVNVERFIFDEPYFVLKKGERRQTVEDAS